VESLSPLFPLGRIGLPLADDPFALALNENPFSPLPTVVDAMVEAAGAANRYPAFVPDQLRELIAWHMQVNAEQIVIGAGATGVIMQVLQSMTEPGDRIVMAFPTFDGYPIFAQIARLVSETVPLRPDGHHDFDRMADAARGARVLALCRPHNPTGTVESECDVRKLLSSVGEQTIVVLDEAYVEFVAPDVQIDVAALVRDFPNVVVVRTFSKAYGLAGIRTGYGYCAPELARPLWARQLPFGSTTMSLAAIEASLRAGGQLRQRVEAINEERRHLRSRLTALDIVTADSHANFLYLPAGGAVWFELLAAAGVRVRAYADGGVRMAVGTRHSSKAVLAALERRRAS
jgi:histidinol-phosphate aminotransferase